MALVLRPCLSSLQLKSGVLNTLLKRTMWREATPKGASCVDKFLSIDTAMITPMRSRSSYQLDTSTNRISLVFKWLCVFAWSYLGRNGTLSKNCVCIFLKSAQWLRWLGESPGPDPAMMFRYSAANCPATPVQLYFEAADIA